MITGDVVTVTKWCHEPNLSVFSNRGAYVWLNGNKIAECRYSDFGHGYRFLNDDHELIHRRVIDKYRSSHSIGNLNRDEWYHLTERWFSEAVKMIFGDHIRFDRPNP